jgi:hypothetical protein
VSLLPYVIAGFIGLALGLPLGALLQWLDTRDPHIFPETDPPLVGRSSLSLWPETSTLSAHPGFADLSGWCVCGHPDTDHRRDVTMTFGYCMVCGSAYCPTFSPPHQEAAT